jgi:hypothetical protein
VKAALDWQTEPPIPVKDLIAAIEAGLNAVIDRGAAPVAIAIINVAKATHFANTSVFACPSQRGIAH